MSNLDARRGWPLATAVAALCSTLVAVAASTSAFAQADAAAGYPSKPIRLVVGFAPGGANDILSRVVAQKMSERLRQPVVVDNKPGAGGFIAAEIVAHAQPDGYTWFSATNGTTTIAPAAYSKMPYDPVKDLAPIGTVIAYPLILVVDASRPIHSVAELVAYAKANPDKSNYGSASALFQLSTELFKARTGAPIVHIPFKGSQDTTAALLNGQLLMSIIDPGPVIPHIKSGKLKLLATGGSKRTPEFPDTPTMKELGIDVVIEVFGGFMTTAGTPPAIIKKLETELVAIGAMPDVQERLKAAGMPVAVGSAEAMSATIAREIPMWTAVAKAANIKLD